MLVLWKTRSKEFSFCAKREPENSRFLEKENPTICGKRESLNSRFVENENPRICGKRESVILFLWKTRILIFWKM